MISDYTSYLVIFLLLILYPIVFIIGYILGKMNQPNGVYSYSNQNILSKYNQQTSNNSNEKTKPIVAIDDRKLVVDIKTDSLEKKYDSLGDVKTSNENISSSVNKLKNMKG